MLATIIIVSLLTILIAFTSAILYLVSLVVQDSDDEANHIPTLGIENHDFNSSPAVSPNDNFPDDGRTLDRWFLSPSALSEFISSKLGQTIGKQIMDDLDSRDMQFGGTALHWCKSRRSLDRLVNLGFPMDARNKRGETAMHVAVRRFKLQLLIGLLCHQADAEARNEAGETALIVACKAGNIFACQLLLVFDADFDARDKSNCSARHYTALICERHMSAQQAPSAAHLILAMLQAVGAPRCPPRLRPHPHLQAEAPPPGGQSWAATGEFSDGGAPSPESETREPGASGQASQPSECAPGCSPSGDYNGNSYNRWSDYTKESLYKRHMFEDIIARKLEETKWARSWPWSSSSRAGKKEARSRMLCIDGGGLRGVIVCQIMIELERYLKRPMISYFDWIGGTSVGAFLACALSLGKSLAELRRICFDVKDEVFDGQRPYSSKLIERVLKETFGSRARMSDIRQAKLAVTATLADRDPCQLRFFRNYGSPSHLLDSLGFCSELFDNVSAHSNVEPEVAGPSVVAAAAKEVASQPASRSGSSRKRAASERSGTPKQVGSRPKKDEEDERDGSRDENEAASSGAAHATLDESDADPLVWQAVRASAAAPFFFKPYGPFLDGGIISNNPTLDMLNEFESFHKVRQFLRNKKKFPIDHEPLTQLDVVVSLGTGRGRVIGRRAMFDFGQVASGFATVFSPVELVRSIRAARDLFRRLVHQSCHTEDHILDRAQAWCSSLGVPYFRVNPPLATIFSIDDKRDEQLINALWQTKLYMMAMDEQLRQLAQILDDGH